MAVAIITTAEQSRHQNIVPCVCSVHYADFFMSEGEGERALPPALPTDEDDLIPPPLLLPPSSIPSPTNAIV